MSSPSTPSRSPSSSTTASHADASPAILTPRSKVQSMLAAIDDDSDSEDDFAAARRAILARSSGATQNVDATDGKSSGTKEVDDGNDEVEDYSDEDILSVVPKGRLAARMQAQNMGRKETANDTDGSCNAYERIKRQLAKEAEESGSQKHAVDALIRSAAEQESELPSPTLPRRRLLQPRRKSPEKESTQQPRSRSTSPLFFPSPTSKNKVPSPPVQSGSDSEHLPEYLEKDPRFMALVAKKREEREEKEAAEAEKKAAREARIGVLSEKARREQVSSSEDDSDVDGAAGRRLTQQARPTRKASKKALEEMNRETQRMSRNMQLAHQARTKKKITKESFLARFNLKAAPAASTQDPISSTASSAPASDVEGTKDHGTPPTSPPTFADAEKDTMEQNSAPPQTLDGEVAHEDEDLPTVEHIMTQPPKLHKGKGKAVEHQLAADSAPPQNKKMLTHPAIRVRLSKQQVVMNRADDSDEDLEIVTASSKTRKIAAFENLPARKSKVAHSLLVLKSLAHLTSPSRRRDKNRPSLTNDEMQVSLRRQARQQAAKERADRLQELRDKGVIIQTAEERERDQAEVEDLVEKVRQEGAEISKKERQAAKKAGTEVQDGLADSSDEDEEYSDGDGEEGAQSGSDEEEIVDEDEEDEESGASQDDEDDEGVRLDDEDAPGGLIEKEAEEEGSDDEPEHEETEDEIKDKESELAETAGPRSKHKSRSTRVISDDENDEEEEEGEEPEQQQRQPSLPQSAKKPFIPGLQMSDDLPLGLTQAFAATMADSQTQAYDAENSEEDALALLRQMPDPGLPVADLLEVDSQEIVKDSQADASNSGPLNVELDYTQTQKESEVVEASPVIRMSTQYSEMPDPTQDVGFVMSPFQERRFVETPAPASTVETILVAPEEESPVLKRKGRLRRRAEVVPDLSDVDEDGNVADEEDDFEVNASVFDVMRKAARRKEPAAEAFDKKKSKAKDAVDEAAEESEDEYAGLGGASDDSAGEEDEDDRKMINDNSGEKLDERKLATFYADKERLNDEQQVSKLLKDITTGALRRKRGAVDDLDLSDSEDDMERRRAAKRREFAKMRKALLADERIGKIAENPKKMAFLRAIEDREDDRDSFDMGLELIEQPEEDSQETQSRDVEAAASQGHDLSNLRTEKNNLKRKRSLEPSEADTSNRLPPHLHRTTALKTKKPSTLAEIRESVSFLIEEPKSLASASAQNSSSEDEDDNNHDENNDNDNEDEIDIDATSLTTDSIPKKKQNDPFTHPRRSFSKTKVIDRLSLLRQASSTSASATRLAFQPSGIDAAGFKIPPLLRRATTSSFSSESSSTSSTGVTERGGVDEKEKIRMAVGAGGKKSSINYYAAARERERARELRGGGGKKRSSVLPQRQGTLRGLVHSNSWD